MTWDSPSSGELTINIIVFPPISLLGPQFPPQMPRPHCSPLGSSRLVPPTLCLALCPPSTLASLLSNMPGTFPPLSLCSGCSFCLEHFLQRPAYLSSRSLPISPSQRAFLWFKFATPSLGLSFPLPQPYFPLQLLHIGIGLHYCFLPPFPAP